MGVRERGGGIWVRGEEVGEVGRGVRGEGEVGKLRTERRWGGGGIFYIYRCFIRIDQHLHSTHSTCKNTNEQSDSKRQYNTTTHTREFLQGGVAAGVTLSLPSGSSKTDLKIKKNRPVATSCHNSGSLLLY